MLDDWELLRILLETARAGGMRKASETLGLTQPTIGKKLDRLEEQVGGKLFYRTKAGMTLTPVGENLYRMAQEMEQLAQRVPTIHNHATEEVSGRLRLAVTDGMGGYWLPQRLRRFHRDHPHVTLDVQCVDAGVEVDLSKREADITVMYHYPTADVVVLQKSTMTLAPFCTRTFIQEWGQPKDIEDVLNFPVCAHYMHYRKEGGMKVWAEMLERHTMVVYRTSSSMVLGNVAKMGIGVSLQPIGVLDREDDVVMLNLNGFHSYLPFFLVCHKDVKDVPSVRTMLQYLQSNLFMDDGQGSPAKSWD
ncbi:MAG: LysR family transcriptional regulator [Alphaproteobacteria bacterium]